MPLFGLHLVRGLKNIHIKTKLPHPKNVVQLLSSYSYTFMLLRQKCKVLTLAVSLCELDFNLTPTNPFPVQVVKRILCISDIFKRSVLLRPFILKFGHLGHRATHMHNKASRCQHSLTILSKHTKLLDLDECSQKFW